MQPKNLSAGTTTLAYHNGMLHSGIMQHNDHGVPTGMVTHTTSTMELMLLPVSIGKQKTTTMVDSGATHNFILMTMFKMLKAAVQGISCYYTAEPLCISLANNSIILSSKMALIPLPFNEHELQMVDFFFVV